MGTCYVSVRSAYGPLDLLHRIYTTGDRAVFAHVRR